MKPSFDERADKRDCDALTKFHQTIALSVIAILASARFADEIPPPRKIARNYRRVDGAIAERDEFEFGMSRVWLIRHFFPFFLSDPLRHGALFSRLNIVMQMGADGIVVRRPRTHSHDNFPGLFFVISHGTRPLLSLFQFRYQNRLMFISISK